MTPVIQIQHTMLKRHRVNLWVKREDLSHSLIPGNKWHKLKLNLQKAENPNNRQLLGAARMSPAKVPPVPQAIVIIELSTSI